MNKSFLSVLLVIISAITINAGFAFTQDSLKFKSPEEYTALKKGNFAIYLEFGSLLFRTSSSSNYSSDNELLLTAKYQLSDKTALRISGGTSLNHQNGNYNRFENMTNERWTNYGSNDNSFNTTVNIQHFLSVKSKIKPFFSLGVYANYYFSTDSFQDYWGKIEEWGIGPFASFGAEMFVLDNVSIIGEYILKGTAGKKYQKDLSVDYNNNVTYERYQYSTVYKADLKSYRVGLSIYF